VDVGDQILIGDLFMKRMRERGKEGGHLKVQEFGGVERMQCFLSPCQQNKNVLWVRCLGSKVLEI
jgi:hypothetical protein